MFNLLILIINRNIPSIKRICIANCNICKNFEPMQHILEFQNYYHFILTNKKKERLYKPRNNSNNSKSYTHKKKINHNKEKKEKIKSEKRYTLQI